jgi:hypothetical protein
MRPVTRRRVKRLARWTLFVTSVLVLSVAIRLYSSEAAQSATEAGSARAAAQAHEMGHAAERKLRALQVTVGSDQSALAAARTREMEEEFGIPGPGTTGVAGEGPVFALDRAIVEHVGAVLQSAERQVSGEGKAVQGLIAEVAADDALAASAKESHAQLARTVLALSLIGGATLASWIASGWTGRRTAGSRGDKARSGQYTSEEPTRRDLLPRVTLSLVNSAVSALASPSDRERYGEEWARDMSEINGKWRQLYWSLLLRASAPRGINRARTAPEARRY